MKSPAKKNGRSKDGESGFSLIELLIVFGIIAIMSAIVFNNIYTQERLYLSEDQALRVMEVMRNASQFAIAEQETIRLDLDINDKGDATAGYYHEASLTRMNESSTETDDEVVRRAILSANVNMDGTPGSAVQPNPPNYNPINYSGGRWSVFFRANGAITTTEAGDIPASGTIFFWTDEDGESTLRAITFFGGTGAIRLWKYSQTGGCEVTTDPNWCQ